MKLEMEELKHVTAFATAGSVLAAGTLLCGAAPAQEVLPKPEQAFKGKIGRTYKDSQPDRR